MCYAEKAPRGTPSDGGRECTLKDLRKIRIEVPYLRTVNRLMYARTVLHSNWDSLASVAERRKAAAALTNLIEEARKELRHALAPNLAILPRGDKQSPRRREER